MTLFDPLAEDVDDNNVPVKCPECGLEERLDGLSNAEKTYLVHSTMFHELWTEYQLLLRMQEIISLFPGTRHPLLADKLPENRISICNDAVVDVIINDDPELRDFLRRGRFRFDRRFPWVEKTVQEYKPEIEKLLLKCSRCEGHYVTFTEQYYLQLGLKHSH